MKAKILKESEADIARTVILATEKMLETRLSK
jgi:hypothetical protein